MFTFGDRVGDGGLRFPKADNPLPRPEESAGHPWALHRETIAMLWDRVSRFMEEKRERQVCEERAVRPDEGLVAPGDRSRKWSGSAGPPQGANLVATP